MIIGRRWLWFQWVHAVTGADVYRDMRDPDFSKSVNERSELLSTIATPWTVVVGVAVAVDIRRLGIDSSRLGQVPEPPSGTAV
jgi:hypothetical protein